ncbi:hypothetical protein XB02_19545 [Pantoea ananatis]|nr:hypothetical protein XB02_19545 [Pantoea ananatis]
MIKTSYPRNFRFWHGADRLTELEVRDERTADARAALRIKCIIHILQSLKEKGGDELIAIMFYKYSLFEDG